MKARNGGYPEKELDLRQVQHAVGKYHSTRKRNGEGRTSPSAGSTSPEDASSEEQGETPRKTGRSRWLGLHVRVRDWRRLRRRRRGGSTAKEGATAASRPPLTPSGGKRREEAKEKKRREDKKVSREPPPESADKATARRELERRRQIAHDAAMAAKLAEKEWAADFGEDPPEFHPDARSSGIERDSQGRAIEGRGMTPAPRRGSEAPRTPPRGPRSPPKERNRGRSPQRRDRENEPNKKRRRGDDTREEPLAPGRDQKGKDPEKGKAPEKGKGKDPEKGKAPEKGKGKTKKGGKEQKGYWTFSDEWGAWVWATFNTKSEKCRQAKERNQKGKGKPKGKDKGTGKGKRGKRPNSQERTNAALDNKGRGRDAFPPPSDDEESYEERDCRERRRSPQLDTAMGTTTETARTTTMTQANGTNGLKKRRQPTTRS